MHYGFMVNMLYHQNQRADQYLIDAFEYAFPEETIHLSS